MYPHMNIHKDLKRLQREVTIRERLEYFVFMSEYIWAKIESADEGQLTVVIDASDAKLTDLSGDTREFLSELVRIMQSYYAERLKTILIINSPSFFSLMWTAFSSTLNTSTRGKFVIVGTSFLPQLLEMISEDQLPMEFGGCHELILGQHPYHIELVKHIKISTEKCREVPKMERCL